MGIRDKLKAFGEHLKSDYPEEHKSFPQPITTKRTLPWPQQTPEEQERKRQQKEKEQQYKAKEAEAYRVAYHHGRIAGARKRGYHEGARRSGGHGIISGVGRGIDVAGQFGLNMQGNLADMFGIPSAKQSLVHRRKRK